MRCSVSAGKRHAGIKLDVQLRKLSHNNAAALWKYLGHAFTHNAAAVGMLRQQPIPITGILCPILRHMGTDKCAACHWIRGTYNPVLSVRGAGHRAHDPAGMLIRAEAFFLLWNKGSR